MDASKGNFRLWVLVMVVVSLLWVPIVVRQQGGQLYIYIQAIAADLSPPIAAVYLLAILWPRANEMVGYEGQSISSAHHRDNDHLDE